jgi:Putative bacterial sensory transduction regulator
MRILSVIAAVLGGCLLLTPDLSLAQLGPKGPQPKAPPPAAAGGALSKVTPEQVAGALTAAGFRAQVQVNTSNNTKFVTTKMRNFNVSVGFYACDAQGCGSMQFISWFTDKVPLEWVNAWNDRWRYVKLAINKEGELVVSLDVLASGGITIENIKENARVFDVLLDELTKFDP